MGEADKKRKTDAEITLQGHGDDKIEQIRASIELTREHISAALDEVQDGVHDSLDWKVWVKKHPKATIGIAFGIGFLLGKG